MCNIYFSWQAVAVKLIMGHGSESFSCWPVFLQKAYVTKPLWAIIKVFLVINLPLRYGPVSRSPLEAINLSREGSNHHLCHQNVYHLYLWLQLNTFLTAFIWNTALPDCSLDTGQPVQLSTYSVHFPVFRIWERKTGTNLSNIVTEENSCKKNWKEKNQRKKPKQQTIASGDKSYSKHKQKSMLH